MADMMRWFRACLMTGVVLCSAFLLSPASAQDGLPDGTGKEAVAKVCGQCHGLDVATHHRDTADGWNSVVGDMIQRGAKGTDQEFDAIVDYLARNFPKTAEELKIAVNTASADELVAGLGLTQPEATAIVKWRQEKGKFHAFADLEKVPGLDASKLAAKKQNLIF